MEDSSFRKVTIILLTSHIKLIIRKYVKANPPDRLARTGQGKIVATLVLINHTYILCVL